MWGLNKDPYLQIADEDLRLLSVFDDLKFDRADADMLSPAMRNHAIQKLGPLGFKLSSGCMILHADTGVRILMPKSHALGASPFDIARYTQRRAQDYYLLTPTQAACQIIDEYSTDDAYLKIADLIRKHPINIYRMFDYLERKPAHQKFRDALGGLKKLQREAVSSEPLCRRRALG